MNNNKCKICRKIIIDKHRTVVCSNECSSKWLAKKALKYYYKNTDKLKRRRFKLRFSILKRDNFTCQYCGRKAPNCELQIDHILPKSKGGLNKIENYRTSCAECNYGKSDILL